MATSFALNGGTVFPEGTSVGAYPRSAWGVETGPTGAPSGSAVATATVTSGVATFTGLTTNTQYYAYANVGGQNRIKAFNTADAPTTGSTPADNSLTTAMLQDAAVSTRKLSDLARTGGWLPAGAIDATVLDREATSTINPSGGVLWLAGGLVVPGGRAVSSITLVSSSTAGAGLTHLWFCLVDQSLNVLATTVDDVVVNGVTTWAANTPKTLLLATAVGGATAGGTYTPANSTEVYAGLALTGTTPPTIVSAAGANSTGLTSIAPMLAGTSTTGLTTPASLGATAGAMSVQAKRIYAYIS